MPRLLDSWSLLRSRSLSLFPSGASGDCSRNPRCLIEATGIAGEEGALLPSISASPLTSPLCFFAQICLLVQDRSDLECAWKKSWVLLHKARGCPRRHQPGGVGFALASSYTSEAPRWSSVRMDSAKALLLGPQLERRPCGHGYESRV